MLETKLFVLPMLAASFCWGGISAVGGAAGNTGRAETPGSLSISYASHSGNTMVAVCAIGNPSSSISSIADNGSVWAPRASVNNGGSVRSEIWSTAPGANVASTSFTINLSSGAPLSCAVEEYYGVLSFGNTAVDFATSGRWSVTLTTQEPDSFMVAGLGANSYFGYSNPTGMKRQTIGVTSNTGGHYVEMSLLDNTSPKAGQVTCSVITASAPWAAVSLELRPTGPKKPPVKSKKK